MDIQVASNFERFIYTSVGRDPARVREVMATFRATGAYRFENFDRGMFSASRCMDTEIPGIVAQVYREHGYIVDPHTACGFKDLNPERVSIVLATASPAKFPGTIQAAIGIEPTHPSLEALKARPVVKHLLKATPAAITAFIEGHAV
jgi:threonine synthase